MSDMVPVEPQGYVYVLVLGNSMKGGGGGSRDSGIEIEMVCRRLGGCSRILINLLGS